MVPSMHTFLHRPSASSAFKRISSTSSYQTRSPSSSHASATCLPPSAEVDSPQPPVQGSAVGRDGKSALQVRQRRDQHVGVRLARDTLDRGCAWPADLDLGGVRVRPAQELLCDYAKTLLAVGAVGRGVALVHDAGVEAVAGYDGTVQIRDGLVVPLLLSLMQLGGRVCSAAIGRYLLFLRRDDDARARREGGPKGGQVCWRALEERLQAEDQWRGGWAGGGDGLVQRVKQRVAGAQGEGANQRLGRGGRDRCLGVVLAAVEDVDDAAVPTQQDDGSGLLPTTSIAISVRLAAVTGPEALGELRHASGVFCDQQALLLAAREFRSLCAGGCLRKLFSCHPEEGV
ncbi:unnamed protein product [Clonostachys rosea]|uniref:Uncharacterized protein n=1 Tax=Bionectria ochroleuca TaxID=29856 RepID=A0ABY6U1I5_BIOOC|nr:unnamed protein product [Clonostachys rosea]